MPLERWLPVVGFESYYAVSNLGRIKSLVIRKRTWPGKILNPIMDKNGYETVVLWGANCFHIRESVHRIVIYAFKGKRKVGTKKNSWQVNHIDGKKRNNRQENLQYVRHSAHYQHGIAMGLTPRGERNARTKLTNKKVLAIRKLLKITGRPQLAKRYGVSYMVISRIHRRLSWIHI